LERVTEKNPKRQKKASSSWKKRSKKWLWNQKLWKRI